MRLSEITDLLRPRRAFTLIEILLVVIILGVLALAVMPMIGNARERASEQVFADNLRNLREAAGLYLNVYGSLPAQAAGAPIPPEIFKVASRSDKFPLRPPIGLGYWHIGLFADVNRWGVGVWWPGNESEVEYQLNHIDSTIDDGDPSAGRFQIRDSARYYWLIN